MKRKNLSDLIRIFEQVNNVKLSKKDYLIESVQLISESKKTREQAASILISKGFENVEDIISNFKNEDNTKNEILLPVMAYFYEKKSFGDVFTKLQNLIQRNYAKPPVVSKSGVNFENENITSFIKFGEKVHYIYDKNMGQTTSSEKVSDDLRTTDAPIFDKNGITIYDANDQSKCIVYTQGGVTGKKYSFCIGQYMHNMYQSYRDTQTSTFYFLVDKNRDFETDPLHIVVVDHTNSGFLLTDAKNNTGNISEYGKDVNGYFEYLKSKGVEKSIFKHRPKTDEEIEEDELLGDQNTDPEWFKSLSFDYKRKYIGRGHRLSDDQFDYLWNNRNSRGYETLLNQYLGLGIPISGYQFELISKDDE